MKLKFSPLVAGASGSTADLTAANWKGRAYVRKKVVPANPQTAAQTAVRESMARCVTLWRSLAAAQKTALDTYGVDYRMSGYNIFCQKNRALEQVPAILKPLPDNPNCAAPLTPVWAAGAAGLIDFTWSDSDQPADYAYVTAFARLKDSNVFTTPKTAARAAESLTLTALDTGEDYDCYAFYWDSTNVFGGTTTGELAVTAG